MVPRGKKSTMGSAGGKFLLQSNPPVSHSLPSSAVQGLNRRKVRQLMARNHNGLAAKAGALCAGKAQRQIHSLLLRQRLRQFLESRASAHIMAGRSAITTKVSLFFLFALSFCCWMQCHAIGTSPWVKSALLAVSPPTSSPSQTHLLGPGKEERGTVGQKKTREGFKSTILDLSG